MRKHMRGWLLRGFVAATIAVLLGGSQAHAAGEWEWTQGQGWVMGAGVSRPTAKEQLNHAYKLEERGEYMDAARQYFLLIQNFSSSEEAGVGLQRLARCLFEMENYYTSYKAIEQVIKTYPNSGRMSDLVEIELRIAKKMMLSETPDLFGSPEANSRNANVRRALEIIKSVIEHDPYGPVAAEANLVRGEGLLFINDVNAARVAFEAVRDEFPRSDFVERARLGILRCDQMVGHAKPSEVQEQLQVVMEAESERQQSGQMSKDDIDDVNQTLKQVAEVEATKMMDQAKVYRKIGTTKAVKSAEFLYKEIARRYPETPQAHEANTLLGNLKVPKEPSRAAKAVRGINLNPFSWNKDPEPPWIVPQLSPEDQVMIDKGLGPIVGVPETGMPSTAAAAGVRPAAMDSAAFQTSYHTATQNAYEAEYAAPVGQPSATVAPGGRRDRFYDRLDQMADYNEQRTYASAPVAGPMPAESYGTASLVTSASEQSVFIPASGATSVASSGGMDFIPPPPGAPASAASYSTTTTTTTYASAPTSYTASGYSSGGTAEFLPSSDLSLDHAPMGRPISRVVTPQPAAYQQQTTYVQPQSVYVQPQPVATYAPPPVTYAQAPAAYAPPPPAPAARTTNLATVFDSDLVTFDNGSGGGSSYGSYGATTTTTTRREMSYSPPASLLERSDGLAGAPLSDLVGVR